MVRDGTGPTSVIVPVFVARLEAPPGRKADNPSWRILIPIFVARVERLVLGRSAADRRQAGVVVEPFNVALIGEPGVDFGDVAAGRIDLVAIGVDRTQLFGAEEFNGGGELVRIAHEIGAERAVLVNVGFGCYAHECLLSLGEGISSRPSVPSTRPAFFGAGLTINPTRSGKTVPDTIMPTNQNAFQTHSTGRLVRR